MMREDCVKKGRMCETHGCSMTRSIVKERAWKKKADGLFGNKTVTRVRWRCDSDSSPKSDVPTPENIFGGSLGTTERANVLWSGGKLAESTKLRITTSGIKRKL